MKETLRRLNGNYQQYTIALPKVIIIGGGDWNDGGKNWIEKQSGLVFKPSSFNNIEAQPTSSQQIVQLIMTYNFKIKYQNNNIWENTLFLKSDHNIGFKVDEICYDCVKHNHIPITDLKPGNYLMC